MAPSRPTPREGLLLWTAVVVLLAVFGLIAAAVATGGGLALDAPLLTWLHAHTAPAWTALARGLSTIGEPPVVGGITLALVLVLALGRRTRGALRFAVQVGGAAALDLVLKKVFARPRPTLFPHLVHEGNFSFPSGHALGDMAFFVALALLARHALPRPWRGLGLVGVALALAIGASRPYLQVHYPSDVLAGWALGAAWALAWGRWLAPGGAAAAGRPGPGKAGP